MSLSERADMKREKHSKDHIPDQCKIVYWPPDKDHSTGTYGWIDLDTGYFGGSNYKSELICRQNALRRGFKPVGEVETIDRG